MRLAGLLVAAGLVSPARGFTPRVQSLSPWVVLKSAFRAGSFAEFMQGVRREQGDAILVDLQPVLPPTYLLMGKEANREVLSTQDPSLEQVLQELINLLPVSARVPSEVDVQLQRRVAGLFQSVSVVNARLPSFRSQAVRIRDRWAAQPTGDPLPVFLELSDYVLRADLEVCTCPLISRHGTPPSSRERPRSLHAASPVRHGSAPPYPAGYPEGYPTSCRCSSADGSATPTCPSCSPVLTSGCATLPTDSWSASSTTSAGCSGRRLPITRLAASSGV